MIDDNELSAWPLIIERIKAQVAGLRDVLLAYQLADVLNGTQAPVSNAAYVVFDGEDSVELHPDGESQIVTQGWLVVLSIHNPSNASAGRGPVEQAGPLYTQIRRALAGWSPGDDYSDLQRTTAPRPVYAAGGYAYFQQRYITQIVTMPPNDLPI